VKKSEKWVKLQVVKTRPERAAAIHECWLMSFSGLHAAVHSEGSSRHTHTLSVAGPPRKIITQHTNLLSYNHAPPHLSSINQNGPLVGPDLRSVLDEPCICVHVIHPSNRGAMH